MSLTDILTRARDQVSVVIEAGALMDVAAAHAQVMTTVGAIAVDLPEMVKATEDYLKALRAHTPDVPDVVEVDAAVDKVRAALAATLVEAPADLVIAKAIISDWDARTPTTSSGDKPKNGKAFKATMFVNGQEKGHTTCSQGAISNTSRWNMRSHLGLTTGMQPAAWVAMTKPIEKALVAGTNSTIEHGNLKIVLSDRP